MSLDDVSMTYIPTFRRWLGDEYDLDAIDVVLATAAAEQLAGDPPLWLLLISGSGNAKTETVRALAGAGAMKEGDYRDLVIEPLADSEANLQADVQAYRALAQQAIHELHELTQQHSRLREQHHRVLDECRHLRKRVVSKAVAA